MKHLRIEKLANGLYRVFDYQTKSASLYNRDGTYRSGDFRLSQLVVLSLINNPA